jgi:OMF family outer membrane factor
MKVLSAIFLAALSGVAAAQPGAQPPKQAPAAPAPAAPAPTPATTPAAPAPGAPLSPPPSGSSSTPATPTAPDPARPTTSAGGEILTLERAIEIAMKQQPTLREAKAALDAAEGRIDQAKVLRNPTISLGASASIGSVQEHPCDAFNPNSPTCGGFFHSGESFTLGANASWRIYDFGQTAANIRAAELTADATGAAIHTTTLDVRTGVETAYLEAVARRRLVQVAETTVQSEDGHLDQAKRFVAAGAKDPIEVAQAQARDANAKSALAQAQSNEATSLANLRSAIGWVDPERSPTVAPNWPSPSDADPPALVALVDTARKRRPEIVQFDKELEAADASLTAARAERRPVLSANASAQWEPSTDDWSPQPSWGATLSLSWALFDGGKSAADQKVARANLANTAAQRDGLLVTLTSQLDSARSQIVANRENVRASTEAVSAARAQLQLAEARYAQGLGSQIELADAQTAVTTAEGNLVTAQFQLATAWAQLRRSIAQE